MLTKLWLKMALVTVLFIIFFNTSETLAASARIVGVVLDSESSEPLPGANVILKGTYLGSSTDLQGYFSIIGIEPGKYIVIADYIGYDSKSIEIDVKPGETYRLKIKLDFKALSLNESIVVEAQVEGQMKAINRQISSDVIKNIVSQARIQELPDANAAEALGRLPGVSINRSGGEAEGVRVRGLGGGRKYRIC